MEVTVIMVARTLSAVVSGAWPSVLEMQLSLEACKLV